MQTQTLVRPDLFSLRFSDANPLRTPFYSSANVSTIEGGVPAVLRSRLRRRDTLAVMDEEFRAFDQPNAVPNQASYVWRVIKDTLNPRVIRSLVQRLSLAMQNHRIHLLELVMPNRGQLEMSKLQQPIPQHGKASRNSHNLYNQFVFKVDGSRLPPSS